MSPHVLDTRAIYSKMKTLQRILPLLLVLLCMVPAFAQIPPIEPGVSHELAKWRAARYSNVRYKLDLTLEKMSPVLKGTMEIRVDVSPLPKGTSGLGGLIVDNAPGGSMPPIVLDWRSIKGHEDRSTVSRVSINGREAPRDFPGAPDWAGPTYTIENEHLVFREGVKPGENVIKLDFSSPILPSGSAITRYVDKEDGSEYIYSLFVPSDASTAFPVFDQPDLKARFTLVVYTEANWKVLSNSKGHRTQIDAAAAPGTFHIFKESKPISTYVFAFAAGPFEKFEANGSVPPAVAGGAVSTGKTPPATAGGADKAAEADPITHIYVRKSQAEKFKPHAAEVFRLNREGINFLEQYFDYKFPFPKYDLVLIPEFPFGGMEHAGATFLREDRVIFPQEPTKNDFITRANVIFHEAAHQWFGDMVTMKWFDDLWLKEGFAEFMAYKTLEKVVPEYNAWKIFYERNKQLAYLTDSTKGTTPIYQEISNLNAAKSAYGNIVYRKAPSFLKQAEFYIGPDKFQTAVRAMLKKHEFKNAEWTDLVMEFEQASDQKLTDWAESWVKVRGGPIVRSTIERFTNAPERIRLEQYSSPSYGWQFKTQIFWRYANGQSQVSTIESKGAGNSYVHEQSESPFSFVFPNYQDYGYGIFLLDDKSRDYVLKNIQNEKDDFLRTMMWGSLWDSVREGELDPKIYIELVIKNLEASSKMRARVSVRPPPSGKPPIYPETDESTIATLLSRVGTAMNYYIGEDQRREIAPRLEEELRDNVLSWFTPERERLTVFRSWLNLTSTDRSRQFLKSILQVSMIKAAKSDSKTPVHPNDIASPNRLIDIPPLRAKDRFDIVAKLLILGDEEAPRLLAELEKTEMSDEAKRYAYAARAGTGTTENKAKYWNDFTTNKEISESWIESSLGSFNSPRHADLTLPYLEKALAELPNLKRSRKIFFVNGWLGAFIGGQKSEQALAVVNKFLNDSPNLDNDLRLKILENVDLIERAIKIRAKYGSDAPAVGSIEK